MTRRRLVSGDLVFTTVEPHDAPWGRGRRARQAEGAARPAPTCVPDLTFGAREWVYILCLGKPTSLKDADLPWLPDRRRWCVPVSHYVGWTRRPDPRARVTEHGGGLRHKVVAYLPNHSERQERAIKLRGTCPACASSLDYLREAWDLYQECLSEPERARLRDRVFSVGRSASDG